MTSILAEILRISAEGLVSEQGVPAAEEPANCIFEQGLLRPSRRHHERQERLCLPVTTWVVSWHYEEPVEADLVIGVPDSACPRRVFSHERYPYEGLIKNRYVGRTFIEPTRS